MTTQVSDFMFDGGLYYHTGSKTKSDLPTDRLPKKILPLRQNTNTRFVHLISVWLDPWLLI